MTEADFQKNYRDIRDAIVDLITENTDPATTRVIGRDVFDDDEASWAGRLTAPDGSVHLWSVFYTGTMAAENDDTGTATESFMPTFRLAGYRGYEFGSAVSNSADKHMDELNALRFAFMNSPRLGLEDLVESHSGFVDQTYLTKIDTQRIHLSRIDMGVQLLPIAYDYA